MEFSIQYNNPPQFIGLLQAPIFSLSFHNSHGNFFNLPFYKLQLGLNNFKLKNKTNNGA